MSTRIPAIALLVLGGGAIGYFVGSGFLPFAVTSDRVIGAPPTSFKLDVLYHQLEDQKRYEVILMAGQSNMVGQGLVSELPADLRKIPRNVKIYDYSLGPDLVRRVTQFGPELTFAQELSEKFPTKDFVIIKYAVGGASMYNWNANFSQNLANQSNLPHLGAIYQDFVYLVSSVTQNRSADISTLFWMQGETDSMTEHMAARYKGLLASFLDKLKQDLAAPEMEIFISQVNPPETFRHRDKVRSAQLEISQERPDVTLVSTRGLAKAPDRVHYNTAAQLELGHRYFAAYVDDN